MERLPVPAQSLERLPVPAHGQNAILEIPKRQPVFQTPPAADTATEKYAHFMSQHENYYEHLLDQDILLPTHLLTDINLMPSHHLHHASKSAHVKPSCSVGHPELPMAPLVSSHVFQNDCGVLHPQHIDDIRVTDPSVEQNPIEFTQFGHEADVDFKKTESWKDRAHKKFSEEAKFKFATFHKSKTKTSRPNSSKLEVAKQNATLSAPPGILCKPVEAPRQTRSFVEILQANSDGHPHHPAQQGKPSLFKTRLCALFVHGKCTHGNSCNFAHSTTELQGAPDLRKTSLCVEYMQSGSCRRQGECRFAHGYGELRHTAEVYKTSLCTFWEYGNCQYGNFCRHAHGLKELRTVEENRRRFNTTMNESGNSSPSRSTNPPSTAGSDNPEPPQYEPPQYADFKTFAALDCGFANEFSAESSAESNESSTSSPGPIGPAAEPPTRCIPVPKPQISREATPITRESTLTEVVSLPFVSEGTTWQSSSALDADAGWDSLCLLGGGGCSLCQKTTASHIIIPCGHQCVCGDCAASLKQCPVCVAPVTSCVKVIAC